MTAEPYENGALKVVFFALFVSMCTMGQHWWYAHDE